MRSDDLFRPSCAVRKLHWLFREVQDGRRSISIGDEICFKKVSDDDYRMYLKKG